MIGRAEHDKPSRRIKTCHPGNVRCTPVHGRARLHGEDWGAMVRSGPPPRTSRLNRALALPRGSLCGAAYASRCGGAKRVASVRGRCCSLGSPRSNGVRGATGGAGRVPAKTTRCHQPRPPLARPGQGAASAGTIGRRLCVVYGGLRDARSEGGEDGARCIGARGERIRLP